MNISGGGGIEAPSTRKGRGPTTSCKKPTGAMVLEYDNKGQPTSKWCREYGNQVGMCVRKIPITLGWRQVPPGLIQTFWDDTRKLFNIPNDADKRRVFEYLVADKFRGFKTFLTNGWIYKKKKKKQKNKACKGKDNEGGNDEVFEEEKLPWQIWPSVKEDEWNAFVLQRSKKKAVELR